MVETTFTTEQGTRKVGLLTSLDSYYRKAKKRARQQNPIMPNSADIVNWILYDRFTFAQAATIPNRFQFFTQPIGTNSKTKVDTNLELVQQLAAPLWMNVIGVGFYISSNTIKADIDLFLNSSYMEFWVGQKVYLEGPLQCFPTSAGLSGVTTQTEESAYSLGAPVMGNMFDVRLPAGLGLGGNTVADGLIGITILQNQQFHVDIKADAGGATMTANTANPTPGAGLQISCYLHGILSRGVQ